MRNISGQSWYKGYTSSAYQAEMNYVKGILTRYGKTDRYLIKAYFSSGFSKEAENLQVWQ